MSASPLQFAFVPTDGQAKIRGPERQLIRHHCMRAKNKQPGSRRSRLENAAKEVLEKEKERMLKTDTDVSVLEDALQHTARTGYEVLVRPPPSDWALFRFAEELELPSQKLMHQCEFQGPGEEVRLITKRWTDFISNPIRDSLYPFHRHGISVFFDHDASWCFRLLVSEKLCFRAMVLLVAASNDLACQHPPSSTTSHHLQHTLEAFRSHLSDDQSYTDDAVLYVAGILASVAVLFGQYTEASIHAAGIADMLRLRGRNGAVRYSPHIQLSIDR